RAFLGRRPFVHTVLPEFAGPSEHRWRSTDAGRTRHLRDSTIITALTERPRVGRVLRSTAGIEHPSGQSGFGVKWPADTDHIALVAEQIIHRQALAKPALAENRNRNDIAHATAEVGVPARFTVVLPRLDAVRKRDDPRPPSASERRRV